MSVPIKLAVIGHPINHSKSPIIHNDWMARAGIVGVYEAIDIAPEDLDGRVHELVKAGYSGLNVTLPHKQSIMGLCGEVDMAAQKIGAVNTVKIQEGKLFGYNTDAYGFIQNIKANAAFDFENKSAFVLGAGGAARAIIQGLIEAGISKIYLTNRTKEKAQELRGMNSAVIEIVDWGVRESVLGNVDLLVNTTSLGMVGKPPLEIDLSGLKKSALVTDIVYTPLMTDLLAQARGGGHDIVSGVGMLLYQAQKSFEIWTGVLPEVDEALTQKVLG